jgi:hypothetical protein
MVKQYVKTVEKHLRKVISMHSTDCDKLLPFFLLAYRTSTHETTSMMPASMVFRRELCLPCDLVFGASVGQSVAKLK